MFVNFNILNQLGSPAINSNTFANRPAAGQTGRLFVSTDTYEIYRDNGTTWDLIGGPGSSTITGSGTATQVAYFTSSQAIGSSANLFWDNTSGFLGVATATPTARIEAVKTDGIGIYANYTTNAGSGSSTTGLWAKNVTNSSGFAAVIEETTPNTTAGQYPLLIKHSLSSGTAGVGMGTGIHWQLPDDAGTFKTTQLTIETINAAAATYATRYRFNVQNNGSSTPVAYINATGVGIFTATPGAALDIHSTGTIAQFNTTSATGNTYIAFQRTGTGLWRVGDTYNGGPNQFEIHNTVLGIDAVNIKAATNKTSWQATESYTSGVARGNYFDYNLTLNPVSPLASPNAITALGASLDLTLQGSIIIPSGARSGLDAYNSISFTTTGTLTHNQGTQIRAYSNLTAGWAFNGSATGTITHLAGLHALFPDNTGSAIAVTNNYALLLNDQTANTGTVTYTNRWGVYQEGASDLNYMAANLLLGSTTNNGNKLQVTGNVNVTGNGAFGQSVESVVRLAASSADNTNGTLALAARNQTGTAAFFVYGDLSSYLAGPVGIGTNAPSTTLDVNGTIYTQNQITGYLVGQVAYRTYTKSAQFAISSYQSVVGGNFTKTTDIVANADTGADSEIRFLTASSASNPTERMRLTSAGSIVFKGTSTTTNLEAAIENSNSTLAFYATLGAGLTKDTFFAAGGSGGAPNMTFKANGNFLIGTTTDAGQKLQVAGTADITQPVTVNSGASGNVGLTIRGNIGPGLRQNFINNDSSGLYNFQIGTNITAVNVFEVRASTGADGTSFSTISRINTTGDLTVTGSYTSAAPSGGTAAAWKLGSRVAATVVLDTTQYIELDVGGTLYKLAIVT